MIISTILGIKNSILMHVIIFFVFIYHFMKKVIIISNCINLRLIMINYEEYFLSLSLLEIIIHF